jgi:membrane fusion protein, multidrug efflux system
VHVTTVQWGAVDSEVVGIGTVTPITSIAVKSRVDGQIVDVPVREGADVRKGDLLFRIDPRPFEVQREIAAANLARDEALLAKAEDLRVRSSDLVDKGYISANQFTDAKSDARAAGASVAADRAVLANARLNLEFTELRAPISGRVGRVQLQRGNLVKSNDLTALMTLNQITPIYVDFSVPERYLGDLRAEGRGGVTAVAVSVQGAGGASVERQGPLTFLDNAVDQPTGTVRLRATLSNEDRVLWPGQFARVKIHVPNGGPVLWVPAAALGTGPEGNYVFLVTDKSTAEQRAVKVLRTAGDRVVLAEGVAAGDRVITDGQSRVLPNMPVTVVTDGAAAAPAVAR